MGHTIIHELLSIIHAGDLKEAAGKTIVIAEAQLLVDPSHIIHAPFGTLKAVKESMLRSFCWFLTGLYQQGIVHCKQSHQVSIRQLNLG